MKTDPQRRRGFSMTEMLVVVGILVLVTGLLLPTLLKSRQQARIAVCQNNLRQLGAFYVLYAERNDDYIPLGVSRWKDPSWLGLVAYTPTNRLTLLPFRWPAYHYSNNHYVWITGAPSAAMGPFLLAGLITPDNSKLLSCPSEHIDFARVEAQYKNVQAARDGTGTAVYTSYGVRPLERLWTHDKVRRTVQYPGLMPKLMRNDHFALLAEDFALYALPPDNGEQAATQLNHGSNGAPLGNILYGDGSVRTFGPKSNDPIFVPNGNHSFREDETYSPVNEDNAFAIPAWLQFDRN